jgi:hypothetical protein
MNETLRRTPLAGQRRAVTTAMRLGPPTLPIGVRATLRRAASFSGFTSTARRAAASSLSRGKAFVRQTISAMRLARGIGRGRTAQREQDAEAMGERQETSPRDQNCAFTSACGKFSGDVSCHGYVGCSGAQRPLALHRGIGRAAGPDVSMRLA